MSGHLRTGRSVKRQIILNTMQRAMAGAAKLPAEDVARVRAGMLAALERFSTGDHCREHWASMADASNVAEELSRLGICSDEPSRALIEDAQRTLGEVAVRAQQRGSWTLYAPELVLLREALERHAIQLAQCSLSEYERAVDAVRRKHAQYAAGNAPSGAIVATGELA